MDVTGLSKLSTTIADTGTKQEVDLAILKRAQQVETSTADALVQGLPQPNQNLPAHLGSKVNTTA